MWWGSASDFSGSKACALIIMCHCAGRILDSSERISLLKHLFIHLAVSGRSCSTVFHCSWETGKEHRKWQLPILQRISLSHAVMDGDKDASWVQAHLLSSRTLRPRSTWNLNSLTKDPTRISHTGRRILNHWTTREVPGGCSNSKNRGMSVRDAHGR